MECVNKRSSHSTRKIRLVLHFAQQSLSNRWALNCFSFTSSAFILMSYDWPRWLFFWFWAHVKCPSPRACISYRIVRFFQLQMLLLLLCWHPRTRVVASVIAIAASALQSYCTYAALPNAPLQATNNYDKLSAKTMTTASHAAELLLMWLTVTSTIGRGVGELVLAISSTALPLF